MILVAGPLAHPVMAAALKLQGTRTTLDGRLEGGAQAGVTLDGWPRFVAGQGQVPALRTDWTPELRRYAGIFGLEPVDGVIGFGQGGDDGPWKPDLAVAMATWLISTELAVPATEIRKRLGAIAIWVDSRLRAARQAQPAIGPAGSEWQLLTRSEPYAQFFSIEHLGLRHRLNSGGWSEPLDRAVFVSGDATVILPWDPVRDRVLLIDQFRAAPAARGDREPWLYETIAGRIDAGETPEEAARREAKEEAGIAIGRVFDAPTHYPSPGAVAEMLYLFVGTADLPDGVDGLGGVETEGEDIRSHVVSRARMMQMVDDGVIRNGPLLVLALWLDRHAARLRRELESGGGLSPS